MIDIQALAKKARLGVVLTHNSVEGDRVWIEGADWTDELEAFAALVLEAAAVAVYDSTDNMHDERDFAMKETIAEAIRAMKPGKEQT